MHTTIRRYEGIVSKRPDGLSRQAAREAVVRDLLQFEGFRSHDNWMRRPGSGRLVEGRPIRRRSPTAR